MANRNVFDTNDIRTTGLTVIGVTILSGNSTTAILTVTGASGTNLQVIDDATNPLIWSLSGTTGAVFDVLTTQVNSYVDFNITGNTTMTGTLSASAKSFDIPHPTLEGYRLRYGSLEGPEHGVYHRGNTKSTTINLPQYWVGLVDEETISVQLTPIGNNFHWVEKIENNIVHINCKSGYVNCFYIIHAERKDIPKILIEYKKD